MGRECSMCGGDKKYKLRVFFGGGDKEDHLQDLGVEGAQYSNRP